MPHTFHYYYGICFVFRMLPQAHEVLKEFVSIGHIEVARHYQVAVYPIILSKERVYALNTILTKSTVAHVPHNDFAYIGEFSFLLGYIIFESRVGFKTFIDSLIYLRENILYRLLCIRAYSADVAFTWRHIELDTRQTSTVLSAVVLFL